MMKFIGFYSYTVILTYVSVISAIVGMVQASNDSFTAAIICLLISGICDAFDGTIARTKKNRTDDEKAFGIQIDSLCDVISFGVFPAFLCYRMGVDGIPGLICICLYSLCAVIRLAFFNVLETKRQQTENSNNKYFRGLPVTSISIIFPIVYLFHNCFRGEIFAWILHGMLAVVALLFILDIKVKKLDIARIFRPKAHTH